MSVTMNRPGTDSGAALLDMAGLRRLVEVLMERQYRVVGPTLRDNAIVLAELESADDLPRGWGVDVAPGHYRLRRRDDDAAFGHSAGPQSWKQFLHPPRQRMWAGTRDGDGAAESEPEAPRYAFLGVRGCDLAAIATLGGVLGRSDYPDSAFVGRRRQIFVVAVNCTEPGGVCFCASMGTGPGVGPGYDLALTERVGSDGVGYVVDVGSPQGADVLAALPHHSASSGDVASARADVEAAADRMGRQMPEVDLRDLLLRSRESPQWEEVASRCLTCGNCTMVCPTCFCTSTEDVSDLTGEHAERWRHWASCFEFDFTYVHGGGSVRQSGASRYRHWLTHKLATWHDQFGMSGCVGCGRCIAWCPTGIDITAEMNKMADDD
ncbi:4Fe-4S dicluster domain-containing protein [Mycobacterium marinum]|uniref:4Fe-4S dicluster domain-containing protein n=1 Tax=Mycobacterium marinum TaxID=1781 RepID=UPI000358DB6A|nr:4Fe-4S dicluster domain-containing protein [Mycobacterium marinum]EPQ77276.1 Ferredoxin [Mycobacterium marinum MB2]MDC8973313.1 4Fe-4S dicluster domain-containing protein [Mycobacterium marinum]MDC9004184.1 4Fe-4S dicluster domain-containing protein [Mycobacterium marinum]QQW36445.1 4Fe-4S dicluster domain-containing protein [Mycobacterium marinum]